MTSHSVDLNQLAADLQRHMADLVHRNTGPTLYGTDFYAEALRRTLGYDTNTTPGQRQLPYDTVAARTGLVTEGQAAHTLHGRSVIERLNRETAEQQVKELRAEVRRVYAEARRDIAQGLREWCNERRIPAKTRREGFLMAADLIDPPVQAGTAA